MHSWMYAGGYLIFVFAWPLVIEELAAYRIILSSINGAIAVNAWYQCHSRELGYFEGLNAISASLMSGCAPITWLYLLPVLTLVWLVSVYYSVLGFLHGRQNAQQRWQTLVLRICTWRDSWR